MLYSDRNLYIAGEHVFFSAFLDTGSEVSESAVSRVLYCELITPWGGKIASGKFLVEDFRAYGTLVIPEDLITGVYYIRAYTKKMRNYGPDSYPYIALKIINPYRGEVQEAVPGSDLTGGKDVEPDNYRTPGTFTISADKPVYTSRDTIRILFDASPDFFSSIKGLTLAVVPVAAVSTGLTSVSGYGREAPEKHYLTENRGLSVTGILTDTLAGRPLPYIRVSLSILGRGRDLLSVQTDKSGRFSFLLPDYTGRRDLFICASKEAGSNAALLIDNDFCTAPVMLPSGMPELSAEERELAYRMAVNLQVGSVFYPETTDQASDDEGEDRAFYGTPDDVLQIDDYIELPTLEEYFNGLPAMVRIRKSKGEKHFRMITQQAGINNFEPLVLIDQVAIDDPELILAIKPSDILRIEVVNKLYVKGDETFGGIISLISRYGDFAGIELPESGVFLNYDFLSRNRYDFPVSPTEPHYPDTRNTLYWNPDLRPGIDRKSVITLNAPDMAGMYKILLSGITVNGVRIRETGTFEVSGK